MSTIRWREGKGRRLWATVIWKVGRRQRTLNLHTTDGALARAMHAIWKAWRRERGAAALAARQGTPSARLALVRALAAEATSVLGPSLENAS